MDILIYSGAGVSGYLLRHVFRFFSRFILDVNRYSIKRIQADYLIGGGFYVGICTGGYVCCASVYFDIPGMIINESRDLYFYRGQAYVPVYARTEFSIPDGDSCRSFSS